MDGWVDGTTDEPDKVQGCKPPVQMIAKKRPHIFHPTGSPHCVLGCDDISAFLLMPFPLTFPSAFSLRLRSEEDETRTGRTTKAATVRAAVNNNFHCCPAVLAACRSRAICIPATTFRGGLTAESASSMTDSSSRRSRSSIFFVRSFHDVVLFFRVSAMMTSDVMSYKNNIVRF
jgi:hypothetical protein